MIWLILKNRDTYYVTKHELCLDVKCFLWSYFRGILTEISFIEMFLTQDQKNETISK